MAKPWRPPSIKENRRRILRGVALWNKTEGKWGVYQKSDKEQKNVLLWLGSNKEAVKSCPLNNVKLPEELRPLARQMQAEREAEEEAKAEREKIEDEAKAKRREKYLESLSEEDREDVLKRERERKWKREDVLERERERERIYREDVQLQEKREYERMPEPGEKRARKLAQEPKGQKQSILDIINEEPEEPEEVFPWEEISNS